MKVRLDGEKGKETVTVLKKAGNGKLMPIRHEMIGDADVKIVQQNIAAVIDEERSKAVSGGS